MAWRASRASKRLVAFLKGGRLISVPSKEEPASPAENPRRLLDELKFLSDTRLIFRQRSFKDASNLSFSWLSTKQNFDSSDEGNSLSSKLWDFSRWKTWKFEASAWHQDQKDPVPVLVPYIRHFFVAHTAYKAAFLQTPLGGHHSLKCFNAQSKSHMQSCQSKI